jgi:hypothetical protein
MRSAFLLRLCAALVALATADLTADDQVRFRPFVLASVSDASLEQQGAATVAALEQAGFSLVGQYAPLDSARVLIVTDPELLAVAAGSDRGGYGAAQRVSVARRDDRTEVAFVNPLYLKHAFRLQGDVQGVYDRLTSALGFVEAFGSSKGLTAKKLAHYHYMMGMQRFDDPSELGEFPDHAAALAAVEAGLARPGDALSRVYRIDLPGQQQSVFGVAMRATAGAKDEQDIDEAHQLDVVDFEGHSKAAYFPYELLVDGPRVEALHMRFRMAVHFPDLSMMGEHGFTSLMASPGATEKALEALLQEH